LQGAPSLISAMHARSAVLDGDYPPLLARKDALEIAAEQLAAHNFACHHPRGPGNRAPQ
jgi:hypothetical protein